MTDYRSAPRKTNESLIASIRMQRGMTQGQLAEMAGCRQKDISRWECGEFRPNALNLLLLARALDCSIDDLVE